MSVFRVDGDSLVRVSEADFGDSFGEVRDVAVLQPANAPARAITITADELTPRLSARLDVWQLEELDLKPVSRQVVSLGDETRARQICLWGPSDQPRVFTIGFVSRNAQILGQILDWGPAAGIASP